MLTRLISELRFRLRAVFRRGNMDRELEDELAFHIERETAKHLAAGIPRSEAERRARATFGSVAGTREQTADVRGLRLVEQSVQDLRYASRSLVSRKAFAIGVVLTLALGVGANATMFGVVDRLLLRPPEGLRDAGQVHRLYRSRRDNIGERVDRNFAFATFVDLSNATRSFSELAAFQTRRLAVGEGEASREVTVLVASAALFGFFDVSPALGRFFGPDEDRAPVGEQVAVLSHDFWQAEYGGRNVVGEMLRVDRMQCRIVGVAPPGFTGVTDALVPAVYVPITAYAHSMRGSGYPGIYTWSWLEILARRRADVGVQAATADLANGFRRSWRNAQATDPGWGDPDSIGVRGALGPVQLERGPMAGRDSRVATWTAGVALIVLLIACANVANLMLARAVGRRREMAMRAALGASRIRLARQVLMESALLAMLGAVAGLAVAQWGASGLRRWFLPADLHASVLTDGRTLAFAAVATLFVTLATGIAPAVGGARADVSSALKAGGRTSSSGRSRLRMSLLVAQAALSLVLLVGAGLFVRSLQRVEAYPLGYEPERVLFATGNPRGVALDSTASHALLNRLLDVAQSLPGVTHAALAASIPFWSNEGRLLVVPGVDSVNRRGRFILQAGTPRYFQTMGTRILRGRAFDETDGAGAPRVVVVGEGMAAALWGSEDPLGRCIRIGADTAPCSTVIGVAQEARLRTLQGEREFTYYIPAAQYGDRMDMQVLVRVDGSPQAYVEPLRVRLQAEMPGAAYIRVRPLEELVDPSRRSWRFGAVMFVAFGILALVIAAVGLYSMIAYDVAQRTRDLGVRIALGAPVTRIVRLVLVQGLGLVAAGVGIGTAITVWTAPRFDPLLFEQSARSPAILAGAALTLLAVGSAAVIGPALRAARVDPGIALRAD